jgi:predicted MFS family arabinose efflux permease
LRTLVPASREELASLPALWRNRDYMLLWGGQVVSTLGSSAASIIYPLLILALTNSPAAAGLASAVRSMPYLLFSLPVGALIDRWDRKRVMVWSDIGRAVAMASIPVALAFDALSVAQLYVVAFAEGTLFVFFNLAEVAALARVVPAMQLPQAAAQNEAAFGVAHIAGPSFGTFLFQTLGRAAPFVAEAVSFLCSAVSVASIRQQFRKTAPAQQRRLTAEIAEGLRWLWRTPLIRTMALLTGGLNMVEAAKPLIVIVIAKQLGANDVEIGLIFSVGAIGGVIGALIGGTIQRRFSFAGVVLFVMWADALLLAFYLLVKVPFLLGVVAALMWTLGPVYNVVQFSYRVALIPDQLQGRVNSTFRLVAFGFNPVGAALAGLLLERFGAGITVAVFVAWSLGLAVFATRDRHVRNARPLSEIAA